MSRAGCSHKACIIADTGYQMTTVYRTVAELKMTRKRECPKLAWGCPCRRHLMALSSLFDVLVVNVNVILGVSDVKILQDFLIPWITGHCDTTQVMFFQDSAPAHRSRTV